MNKQHAHYMCRWLYCMMQQTKPYKLSSLFWNVHILRKTKELEIDQRNHSGAVDNLNQNNSFVNLQILSFLCEISGAILLALSGLMERYQFLWQADKIQVNFKIFKT